MNGLGTYGLLSMHHKTATQRISRQTPDAMEAPESPVVSSAPPPAPPAPPPPPAERRRSTKLYSRLVSQHSEAVKRIKAESTK